MPKSLKELAGEGKTTEVIKAIKAGRWGSTHEALVEATRNGHLDTAAALLKAGARISDMAVAQAAAHGQIAILKLFEERGWDPKVSLEKGETGPLRLAARYGKTEALRFLLERGAKEHPVGGTGAKYFEGEKDLLGWAALGGHVETIRMLLEKGFKADSQESAALGYAALEGNEDVSRILLENGADPLGNDGVALFNALNGKFDSLTELLLQKGRFEELRSDLALMAHCSLENIEKVQELLLRVSPNRDHTEAWPETALEITASTGNLPLLKLLLEHGARLDGSNALHIAINEGHAEIVDHLLEIGEPMGPVEIGKITFLGGEAHTNGGWGKENETGTRLIQTMRVLIRRTPTEALKQIQPKKDPSKSIVMPAIEKELSRRGRIQARNLREVGEELEP